MGTEIEPVPVWSVPFQKNPYFTGREDDLIHLHDALIKETNVALTQAQTISGLGGIGKTQLAIEYAYRYRNDYQYVFWVRADTNELLISDLTEIASLVNLPVKDEKEQSLIVGSVKNWLQTHTDWFLILDNADNLEAVRDFLPKKGKGHVLLTTRAPMVGIEAQGIELDTMQSEESDLFLLRRARLLALDASIDTLSDIDRTKAHEIAEIMGKLPLALAQAGAYIERTRCGLSGYLERYQQRRVTLLKERSGLASDHPEPVATTWSLSFEKVEQANPAAADLLRLCAFLHPDAIPEEILINGVSSLTPALQSAATDLFALDNAIVELLKYSLIRRNLDAKTLTIHRLVQAVLKDVMDADLLHEWAERTVRAVNYVFPDTQSSKGGEQSQRYLPHAQVCAALIKQWEMNFLEAAHLLNNAGYLFYIRGQYIEAEQLLQQALSIGEKDLRAEHIEVAHSLTNLAELYRAQGKYNQALPLCEQARVIHEKTLRPDHPDVAQDLNDLATLYADQGKYSQAEPLYQQARTIQEKALGPDHPAVALTLGKMATVYVNQGKFGQAEQLYRRVYTLYLRSLGQDNIKTMEALKLCNNTSQKARQRNKAKQKTRQRGKKRS